MLASKSGNNIIVELLCQARIKANGNECQERMHVFMFPYYSLVRYKVMDILVGDSFLNRKELVEQVTYQIVSYAYETYFKFVYPYEYRLAKNNGLLKGQTDKEKNDYFIETLSAKEEWILYCFEKYPKLNSMLKAYSKGIITHLKNLTTSIETDCRQLKSYFCIEEFKVKDICIVEGDLHAGRCVSSVTFQNDIKLYYKPRNAANEKFLLDVTSYLGNMGLRINIGIPLFLDKDTYSWHLHINGKELS